MASQKSRKSINILEIVKEVAEQKKTNEFQLLPFLDQINQVVIQGYSRKQIYDGLSEKGLIEMTLNQFYYALKKLNRVNASSDKNIQLKKFNGSAKMDDFL